METSEPKNIYIPPLLSFWGVFHLISLLCPLGGIAPQKIIIYTTEPSASAVMYTHSHVACLDKMNPGNKS